MSLNVEFDYKPKTAAFGNCLALIARIVKILLPKKVLNNQPMKKIITICFAVFAFSTFQLFAQIPTNVLVQISKAEDELRFDKTLENLLKNSNAKIRARAALASGRIGKETAIPFLTNLLASDSDLLVRQTAAFALGEIESIKAADIILKVLQDTKNSDTVRARAVEAAGKIAAANSKDEKTKILGEAILDALDYEDERGARANREVILLGITAILRAKPESGDSTAAKFLTNADARIRADAANTLSRLRSKTADEKLRAMLLSDPDPIARANAARALGAAEDQNAFNLLLEAAVSNEDLRVRVSAIRSLASLKDAKAADRLLQRGENLLTDYKKSKFANPSEKNELLEIATTLGRILLNTNDEKALNFLNNFRQADKFSSPETEIAYARIAPVKYAGLGIFPENKNLKWQALSSRAQAFGELAISDALDSQTKERLQSTWKSALEEEKQTAVPSLALSDYLQAYANFKPADLSEVLRKYLTHKDVIVRATAVGLLGELPPEQIQFGDFEDSFRLALEDKKLNDALLATIEAIEKQKTARAIDFLKNRLYVLQKSNPKYGTSKFLARRRIAAILKEKGAGDFSALSGKTDSIFSNADYVRAATRRNARAILTTEKGSFTIEFFPEDAPLTVQNFIKLARRKYFDGLAIHRVVPNFVVQDGDPRGDGNGSPGWEIRDEINQIPYERGTVGMALSGKDTGGSQWFVCHSPQPHLDGGYTVFGRVNETDMKIVDNLVRGDKILSVKIIEGNLPRKSISYEQTRKNTKIKKN